MREQPMTILCVDYNESRWQNVKQAAQNKLPGAHVVIASSFDEAAKILESTPVDILLFNTITPDREKYLTQMAGMHLISHARRQQPDIQCIAMADDDLSPIDDFSPKSPSKLDAYFKRYGVDTVDLTSVPLLDRRRIDFPEVLVSELQAAATRHGQKTNRVLRGVVPA